MADNQSFDITTGCDLQEIDNAINQAHKEIAQRYDFKNITFTLEFKRAENELLIVASDAFKLEAIWDVLQAKCIKRNVPTKNLQRQEALPAASGSVRQVIKLQQTIESDVAKKIVKYIKDQKLKKVQASIQDKQVRVVSPSRDELQQVMALLKTQDFGIALQFGNYR